MASTPITSFINKFDGGARPNLFEVEIVGHGINAENMKVHCKAAALPASILGEIPVNYMGRIIKLPGDRTYEDWTITVLNDEGLKMRHFFEDWNRKFNNHVANAQAENHMSLIRGQDAIVRQLDRTHTSTREYKLHNIWCDNVSAVDLSYDTPDTISEFTVTLKYQYFTVPNGTGGNITT